jgi:hypothetical protein
VKRGHHIVNKSTKAMPYINRAVKRESWLGRNLWSWADRWQAACGEPGFQFDGTDGRPDVDVVRAGIHHIGTDGETVVFEDGTEAKYDVILFATGYKQVFPFLHPPCTSKPTAFAESEENEEARCSCI